MESKGALEGSATEMLAGFFLNIIWTSSKNVRVMKLYVSQPSVDLPE